MSGNTFGHLFRVTSFGESHGPAIGCVIDGCPPELEISEADFNCDMARRKPGQSKFTTQRREDDKVTILSGIFEGKTTGAPIALIIENQDQKTKDYNDIKSLFRPGHADYTFLKKYGIRDYRGGGRASARETAARVAAGVIAKKYLKKVYEIDIRACVSQIGHIKAEEMNFDIANDNPFHFPDSSKLETIEQLIEQLRREGDSIGAQVSVKATSVPVGWGDPVFDKLDANLAHAMMSINAAKGVEIGAGFDSISQRGSEHRDEITPDGFLSNHAGGTLGGISTGQQLIVHTAFKPTSSIVKPGKTVNVAGEPAEISTKGRHDPCVGIRAVPIVEAMTALVLIDSVLRHQAQNLFTSKIGPVIPANE